MPRILQVLFLFGLLYFLYRVLWKKKDKTPVQVNESTEPMVKDPVCGTFIPKSQGVELVHKGRKILFCSDKCKKEYQKKNK